MAQLLMNAEPEQWKVPAEALLWVTESRRPQEQADTHPATLRANSESHTEHEYINMVQVKGQDKIMAP